MKPHIFGLILILFFGCSNSQNLEIELEKADINWKQKEAVVFLPYQGCSVCLNKAYEFMDLNVPNDQYLYVFVNFESRKDIAIRLRGRYQLTDSLLFHFIKDAAGLYQNGISHFYPSIAHISSGKIDEIIIADPYNLKAWDKISE